MIYYILKYIFIYYFLKFNLLIYRVLLLSGVEISDLSVAYNTHQVQYFSVTMSRDISVSCFCIIETMQPFRRDLLQQWSLRDHKKKIW